MGIPRITQVDRAICVFPGEGYSIDNLLLGKMKAKKLIEVAMPIKEISAESVRDKSIRHGHISTLHLWWARRPLPTCRAVVFASLVPDPLDDNCPPAFKDAVYELLQKENIDKQVYAPYPDIPYTAVHDPMEDNLRNRLLMFIGKFSPKCQANMLAGKTTPPKDQLMDGCLIKWESKNDERILGKARKLIWVAYNSEKYPEKSYIQLSEAFDSAFNAIKKAEDSLYSTKDRHQRTADVIALEDTLKKAINEFQSNMPSVFDPFAGGGAIPLEAARLGCRSYGNDINPVAHIIEKGSAEFPQKYGKPIVYSREEFNAKYGDAGWQILEDRGLCRMNNSFVEIDNRLSFDVEYYAKLILSMTRNDVGYLYPEDNEGNTPIAYYWVRTSKCSNPTCGVEVPMMKGFYMSNSPQKKIYLKPVVQDRSIDFEIAKGICDVSPWNHRGNITCPCCGNVTNVEQVKKQACTVGFSSRLLAVINDGPNGKEYRLPSESEKKLMEHPIPQVNRPQEWLPIGYNQAFPVCQWGFSHWGDIFSNRQILMIDSFIRNFEKVSCMMSESDYSKVLLTYLAIWIDRIAIANTSFGVYHTGRETLERILGRQSLSMTFDYPESNPFCGKSGSAENQLEWILRYIESECLSPFYSTFSNISSGEKEQFARKSITSVVTDPPYYDAIGYADCSDFFYVWLKRTIGNLYQMCFSTPQTPKSEECTAIKHHHNNSETDANKHFENKLLSIFKAIEEQTDGVISIMFAHQSTEAWTTLCNSILGANMNIMGSWAMDTEMQGALKTDKDFLESSVTVACRPSERKGYASFKKVKESINEKVSEEVRTLYSLGFRGADLLTACFGKAVSEFGNYEAVEKADGSEVSVAELLDLARTSAYTALLRDFTGDDYTKFYIGWLQLNGMGDTDYDDATKFTRVGMNVNIGDIQRASLLIKTEGSNKQHLASYNERGPMGLRYFTEEKPLIDKVHYAMKLWKDGARNYLLPFVSRYGNDINNEFWRVLVVLKELLPATTEDYAQVSGLLQNAESLIRDSKDKHIAGEDGPTLFDNID